MDGKIEFVALDRHVSYCRPGGYVQLQFVVRARRVGGVSSQAVGAIPAWQPIVDACEETSLVSLYLHQLVFYMSKGYTSLDQLPAGQSRVVMHLGECSPCCCPWHLRLGSKAENKLRGTQARRKMGRHRVRYDDATDGM